MNFIELKKILFCMLICCVFSSEVASEGKTTFMDVLNNAERIRKSDTTQFDSVLKRLATDVDKFSVEENCFYRFLKYYQEGHLGEYNDTIDKLTQLSLKCESYENQLRIKKFLANMQMIKGDFKQAITNLNDAINLSDKIDDSYLKSQVLNVASISYRLMHQDSLSLKYAELLINTDLNPQDRCLGQFNKYRVLMRQGYAVSNETGIKQAIENCYSSQNVNAALFLQFDWYRYTITESEENAQIAENASIRLKNLYEQVQNTGFKNIQVYYQALLSRILYQAQKPDEAENYALQALESNTSIGETEQLLMALEVLIEINIGNKKFKQGYEYLQKKADVEGLIYERKLASQVAYFRVKHENLAQQLEIDQLNQNNDLLTLENMLAEESSKKQKLMLLLILSLLMLLSLWAIRIKKRHDYFREVAEIDHLTQVFTRKAFEEKMKDLMADCEKQDSPINLAILDLDHFKKVNDLYGHLVGDWVLKNVILVCEEVADEDIMIARLGGEEFVIVSPGIDSDKMMNLIEKMRNAIAFMDCRESGVDINITASFGVTNSDWSEYRMSLLLTHADLALFEAKNNGRNKVVSYDDMQKTESTNDQS